MTHTLKTLLLAKKKDTALAPSAVSLVKTLGRASEDALGPRLDSILSNPVRLSPVKIYRRFGVSLRDQRLALMVGAGDIGYFNFGLRIEWLPVSLDGRKRNCEIQLEQINCF